MIPPMIGNLIVIAAIRRADTAAATAANAAAAIINRFSPPFMKGRTG